jgi:TRAP-type C4-dicarboxylate transport system substrate-binding protein
MTAAVRTIRYGSLWPEGHFGRDVAKGFADAIARGTNGRIVVEVTPPLPDDDLTNDVLGGKLAMTSGHAIQDHVPEFGLGYLPYLYRSYDEYTRLWSLGTPLSDAIAANIQRRRVPVVLLGYSVIGFRDVILRQRRIERASDFQGLKIRFDGSTTSHDTFTAFGALPQGVEYHQVKDALAQGRIDAAANTSYNLIYMQWAEVAKNVSLTSHQLLTNLEIVNADFWASLDASDQDLFRASMRDACARFCATAKQQREVAVGELSSKYGCTVNAVPDAVKADLDELVQPMKREFVKRYGLDKEYQLVLAAGR